MSLLKFGILLLMVLAASLACAALVKEHDAIRLRIEIATVVLHNSAAWPTMQENYGLPFRVAALLVIEFMNSRNLQTSSVEGLNLRVQSSKFAHAESSPIVGLTTDN